MNARLMSSIIKELNQIELKEKSIAETEIQLAVQWELKKQMETKEERRIRELRWILTGEGYP